MKAVLFILCIPIILSNYHSSGTGRNLLFCDQHKSQGQTLSVAGLKLNEGCFFPESGWLTPWTSMHYKEKRLYITRLYINWCVLYVLYHKALHRLTELISVVLIQFFHIYNSFYLTTKDSNKKNCKNSCEQMPINITVTFSCFSVSNNTWQHFTIHYT